MTGGRLHHVYFRIGGVYTDMPPGWVERCDQFLDYFLPKVDEYDALLTQNPIFLARTKGVGKISRADAIALGASGPVARASGVAYDVRKAAPYEVYDRMAFDVPVQSDGDCYARYLVRLQEMREYVRIIAVQGESAAAHFLRQAVAGLLLALTALLIVWMAALPAILAVVGHGLPPAQRALVAANVERLIPYYCLTGINLLGYGVLQSRRVFLRSALIPIATPLIVMALVALGSADLGVLIGSLTLGTGAETVLILLLLFREQPRSVAPAAQTPSNVGQFAWGTLLLMPGTLVTGLSPVIEQTIASGLGHGTISALGYAAKLPATLNALLTAAIGVTILPYFAEQLARGDEHNCRRFFVRYTALVTVAGAAIAAVPAAISANVFARFSFTTDSYFRIASILVLRYAPPAIPATHSTGASRYNSQTLRMPCA